MFKLKDYNLRDTIAAPATFPSPAALGVIKISGKKAISIISKIFVSKRNKDLRKVKTHTIHYGWIVEKRRMKDEGRRTKRDTSIVDEVLVSIMRNPYSYTKEDVVEISCHGGVLAVNKILELVLAQGARLALPGEFTYRAFINGRINLLQAQSITDIITAKSENSLRLAVSQLKGQVSENISLLREMLKDIFCRTEAVINFPEDGIDLSKKEIAKNLEDLESRLKRLLESSREARIFKEGLRCVICGKTNVGKSTLFNRLLKEERVIVSRRPGTTRDVIEETIIIKGVPLKIYDTAGLIEPKDLVAKKALSKTWCIFEEADLVIMIIDASRLLDKDDLFLLDKIKGKNALLIMNKIDAVVKLNWKDIPAVRAAKVKISALKNIGIKKLEDTVYKMVYKQGVCRQDLVFLNQYQRGLLEEVYNSIVCAGKFLKDNYTIDYVNFSLKEAVDKFSKLSGEVVSEEVLESIFSKFCIGK